MNNININDMDNTAEPAAKKGKRKNSKTLLKKLRRKAWILLMFVLTAAMTYAWYASGAVIYTTVDAGELVIKATAYTLEPDNSDLRKISVAGFTRAGGFNVVEDTELNLREDPGAILNESNWEPNIYNAKLIRVSNEGTVPANVKLYFKSYDDGYLGEVLWYDMIPLDSSGASERDYARKYMDTIGKDISKLPVYKLAVGESQQFILLYGVSAWAGNTYQDKEFGLDVEIRAVQDSKANPNQGLPADQAMTDAFE